MRRKYDAVKTHLYEKFKPSSDTRWYAKKTGYLWLKQELRKWQVKHGKGPTDVPVGSRSEWHLDKRIEGIIVGHISTASSEEYIGQHYIKYKEGKADLIKDIKTMTAEVRAEMRRTGELELEGELEDPGLDVS